MRREDLQKELDRRKPGSSRHVTQRRETDTVEILSGIYEGKTTGTAIGFLIRNEDQRSKDYAAIARQVPPRARRLHLLAEIRHSRSARRRARLGARDRDPRRGGRDREEVAAASATAWWSADTWRSSGRTRFAFKSWDAVDAESVLLPPNSGTMPELETFMDALRESGDSCGARVNVVAENVPVGWGEPVYGRLDADIAAAMMSINAVKGVEIGAGFASIGQKGSEHGDEMTPQGFLSNNNGGVLGGISTGQDVTVSIALKPTSSIRLPRRTIDTEGAAATVQTTGRHDPCVGIRATPIAEAMLACVLMDQALRHRAQCGDVVPPIAGLG